jgi:hypothetical protein
MALALLAISSSLASAQKPAEQSKTLLYNQVTGQASAWNRDVKSVYAGRFQIVDIRPGNGFTPGRMKTHDPRDYFPDPRPEREEAVPARVVLGWVVTPQGTVIEPRVLHSTDQRIANSLLHMVALGRYAPARFRDSAVFSLWGHEFIFGSVSKKPRDSDMFKNGLGIQGQRDR